MDVKHHEYERHCDGSKRSGYHFWENNERDLSGLGTYESCWEKSRGEVPVSVGVEGALVRRVGVKGVLVSQLRVS